VNRHRLLALLAATALATAPLTATAPAAHAAPVFTDSATKVTAGALARDDTSCTETNQVVTPPILDVPLVENGPAVTHSGSGTDTIDGPVGDHMTAQSSGSMVASASSAGGNPKSIDATLQGTVATTSSLATSSCQARVGFEATVLYGFTVAQAGFLTVHVVRKGVVAFGELRVERVLPPDDGSDGQDGSVFDIDQTTRIFLTPGSYQGGFNIGVGRETSQAHPAASGSVSVHATFAVAGSQSMAAAGKGGGYVTLPSARSCATHSLVPVMTGKKKKAEKIKQVSFFVNDAKVKSVKHPKKGSAVSLPVPDGVDAELRAVVQLLPKKKGHRAKELEVTSAYVACTS
jgi:hypothetical protein